MVGTVLAIGEKILDRVLPDHEAKEQAKRELRRLELEGEFKSVELQLSAIVAEAQSQDKWTSRARPSFLYVMYFMILSSIPMGFLFWLNPLAAESVIKGVQGWLGAIPGEMWTLFGVGYLGYTGARTFDKLKAPK